MMSSQTVRSRSLASTRRRSASSAVNSSVAARRSAVSRRRFAGEGCPGRSGILRAKSARARRERVERTLDALSASAAESARRGGGERIDSKLRVALVDAARRVALAWTLISHASWPDAICTRSSAQCRCRPFVRYSQRLPPLTHPALTLPTPKTASVALVTDLIRAGQVGQSGFRRRLRPPHDRVAIAHHGQQVVRRRGGGRHGHDRVRWRRARTDLTIVAGCCAIA